MSVAHEEELADVRSSLESDRRRIGDIEHELASLGAIIHSADAGAVDFPSFLQGREVRLCWQLGEHSIGFWHEIHSPLSNRQPIQDLEFSDSLQSNFDPQAHRNKPGSLSN
jgi:hypothetical protein